jgi:hypothetical protein
MFDPADPDRPVKAFLQEYQTLFGFGPEALDDPAMAALVQSGADLPLSSPPAIAAAVTCARQFEFGFNHTHPDAFDFRGCDFLRHAASGYSKHNRLVQFAAL